MPSDRLMGRFNASAIKRSLNLFPRDSLNYALILSIVLLIYHSAFKHGFIQDDYMFIDAVSRGFDAYNAFVSQFFAGFFYRPLTLGFSYYLGYSLFHLNAFGYHLITFTLFLLTNVVVYALGKELTGRSDVALIAAIFYATRGALFTEVYWIGCGFTETGTVLFILLAAYAYLAFLKSRRRLFYASSFVLFLLSLASKELAVVVPALLLLMEAHHGGFKPWGDLKGIALRILPFAAVTLAYLSRLIMLRPLMASGPYAMAFTVGTLVSNISYFLGNSFNNSYELALLALFFAAAFLSARDRKHALSYLAWFMIGLLPVVFLAIHIVPYYLSLPLAGLALLLATGVRNCYDRLGTYKGVLAAALAVLLVANGFASIGFQEGFSGIMFQEINSDRALQSLKEASSYPDGSLIYIKDPDVYIYAALGMGDAIDLYYGDNVSVYFENMSSAIPPRNFTGVYYFDYRDGEMYFEGKAGGPDGRRLRVSSP